MLLCTRLQSAWKSVVCDHLIPVARKFARELRMQLIDRIGVMVLRYSCFVIGHAAFVHIVILSFSVSRNCMGWDGMEVTQYRYIAR